MLINFLNEIIKIYHQIVVSLPIVRRRHKRRNTLCHMTIDSRHTLEFPSRWDIGAMRKAVLGARRVVLVAHTNADGDAVGSLLGMYHLLSEVYRHEGVDAVVTLLLPDGCPDELAWLPGATTIVSGKTDVCIHAIGEADLVVGLDISGFGRTGTLEQYLRASKAYKILIDHHEAPERDIFNALVSEPEASSTCELVYWVMRETFGQSVFTTDAAACLYTGMCTDTGTFSYSNTQPSLYVAAAELLAFGIDPMEINRQIKNVFTEARLRFFGYAMAHRLTVYVRQRVALMVLTADDMRDGGVESSELTGLINEVMKLQAIDCGILVREEEGKVRLSLRSKVQYDVNQLAREMFDGGGHQRAAGATSTVSLDETVKIVKQRLHLEDC